MSPAYYDLVLHYIYENYCSVPDLHKAAYELNPEYKIFWDSHSEKVRNKFKSTQKLNSARVGIFKFKEGLFHLGTMGISFGVKKLFNAGKLSRKQQVKAAATSQDITDALKALNDYMW